MANEKMIKIILFKGKLEPIELAKIHGHQIIYFFNPSKKQWSPPQTSISYGTGKISQAMYITNLTYDSTKIETAFYNKILNHK